MTRKTQETLQKKHQQTPRKDLIKNLQNPSKTHQINHQNNPITQTNPAMTPNKPPNPLIPLPWRWCPARYRLLEKAPGGPCARPRAERGRRVKRFAVGSGGFFGKETKTAGFLMFFLCTDFFLLGMFLPSVHGDL